jgi:hypothetical protein
MAQESAKTLMNEVLEFCMLPCNCPKCGHQFNPFHGQARCSVGCSFNGLTPKAILDRDVEIADKDLDKIVKGDKAKFSVDSNGLTIWEF